MKNVKLFVLFLSGLYLLVGCGKPNDPETVVPPDYSGGYKVVTKFATSGYAQDVLKKDTLLYMAQGEGGLEIIDISNIENPEVVSTTTDRVRGYSTKIVNYDTVVYIAAGSFGVTVVDVANPVEPIVTQENSSMKPAKNLHIMGNYLFTAVSELGVKIADITYLPVPDPKYNISTSGFALGLTTSSDSAFLFVACGEMGLSIYDISDLQQISVEYPPRVGWCDTPGKAENVIILEEESIAFMACGTAGLQIIDYADTNNVHVVGVFDGGGYAKDLMYRNNKIYQTAELAGLQIIDVSDYTNPTIVGVVDTEFALGLDMDDEYIYVADETEGLIIISIPN